MKRIRKINKTYRISKNDFIIIKRLGILFVSISFLLLTAMKCEEEDYFTPEELEIIDVYSIGDTFSMVSTKGDTFMFVIKDKALKEKRWSCSECLGTVKYEELTYVILVKCCGNKVSSGRATASSLEEPVRLIYSFVIDTCRFECGISFRSEDNTTVTIKGTLYENSYCRDQFCCFAKGIGFIKLTSGYCKDTLTLIK